MEIMRERREKKAQGSLLFIRIHILVRIILIGFIIRGAVVIDLVSVLVVGVFFILVLVKLNVDQIRGKAADVFILEKSGG